MKKKIMAHLANCRVINYLNIDLKIKEYNYKKIRLNTAKLVFKRIFLFCVIKTISFSFQIVLFLKHHLDENLQNPF